MYMVASWACEVTEILTQRSTEGISCVFCSDITIPTSNKIPDMHMAVSIVYDTFFNSFSYIRVTVNIVLSFILTEMKLSVLLLSGREMCLEFTALTALAWSAL